jgi:hypothetical protein
MNKKSNFLQTLYFATQVTAVDTYMYAERGSAYLAQRCPETRQLRYNI